MTIDLWSVDLDDIATRPELLAAASLSDRAASAGMSTETLRRRFIARRAVTRHILARSAGLPAAELRIDRSCASCGGHDHGRPQVIGPPIKFSVSSCGGRAVIAVADQQIGVDIEDGNRQRPWRSGLPRAVLAPREGALVDSRPTGERTRTFLQMWVAKEAVLKADGRGLSVDPSLVDTSTLISSGVGPIRLDGATWMVQSVAPGPVAPEDLITAIAEVASTHSPSAVRARSLNG